MCRTKKSFFLIVSVIILISTLFLSNMIRAQASDYQFVLLSRYSATLDVGESLFLAAVATNGKAPTWKSSDSSIVSVNSYGKVTAKKAGTATITAKVSKGEASCRIKVRKTEVKLDAKSMILENGDTGRLYATTSNGSDVTWKSSKRSIATIDEYGLVTALKPGETTITAKADGTTVSCKVTVKTPQVKLNKTAVTLYRTDTVDLDAKVSSHRPVTWKSNKKSVATVNKNGVVTALKHGTATITATVDGVSKTCEVTVKQPTVSLDKTTLNLKPEETAQLTATVSSGNKPTWYAGDTAIASVDEKGVVTAHTAGKTYIYVTEDGIKSRCVVKVTE